TTGYMYDENGNPLTGVQQWYGTYYYFDPVTKKKVNHNYVQSQWGDWYMFGNDGKIITGAYDWMGDKYFFDPNTYLKVNNDYRTVGDGSTGYLLGTDGKALNGVQKWSGTYYYFDPNTYLKVNHNYVQSQWGDWYMFGEDGRIVTGVYDWMGQKYYFDPSTYLKVSNRDVVENGIKYHAAENGVLTVINNTDAKVARALSQQGVPYVWGGNTPAGFDCSGLVQWAYGLGANYRTTYQQTTLGAHHYDVSNAPKGSLLFFGSDSAPYHVAISLGNGSYVHAPEPGDVVKIGYQKYFSPSYYVNM
uniref:NlpC/P60 family protein n=1 Tax=uncultured Lentilactobacillus sp. TaxID=2805375 RepID=UPI0025993B13